MVKLGFLTILIQPCAFIVHSFFQPMFNLCNGNVIYTFIKLTFNMKLMRPF